MATIITKNSQTASAVPSAASLSVGELAVNTADGKLYTEHTGGVVKEIIPSTVVDGGITTAKIADSAVTTAKIADANVTGAKLENSGVTAGTYTTATVTVDAKGRITSASSGSGGGVSSLNGQTGAITNTSLDAIGSVISAVHAVTASPYTGASFTVSINCGDTVAGSSLRRNFNTGTVDAFPFTNSSRVGSPYTSSYNQGGTALSGTWRCMGRNAGWRTSSVGSYEVDISWGSSLFVRVS
jgi:hypothetical protein